MINEEQRKTDAQLDRAIGMPDWPRTSSTLPSGRASLPYPRRCRNSSVRRPRLRFLVCAVAMTFFVTSFALAGSRVSLTGGLYAYAEVAFGRYVGSSPVFLLYDCCPKRGRGRQFLCRTVTALVPWLNGSAGRVVIMLLVYTVLAVINIRGVRHGASAVGVVTVAKLVPLLILVAVGIFYINPAFLAWPGWPGTKVVGDSVLLLLFAFFGIEVALIPSGEVKDPARTVPRAITSLSSSLLRFTFLFNQSHKVR
jgi:amino acid transporter